MRSAAAYQAAVERGRVLLQGVYQASVVTYNPNKLQKLADEGISGAGPFYWLGAEMSRVIVEQLGAKKLANVVPLGGVAFCRLYFQAVAKTKNKQNLFPTALVKSINSL